jgi:hypothetical protein
MTLTKTQHQELDSCKSSILRIESILESAQNQLEIAIELEDKEDIKKFNRVLEACVSQRKDITRIQAESMHLEYDLVVDLIFDRENTLNYLANQ